MSTIKTEAVKQSSGRVLLAFLELTYNNTVYKFVNNPVDVGGYTASNFRFTIPSQKSEHEFSTILEIDNIDRTITEMIRNTFNQTLPVVLWYSFSDTPTVTEIGKFNLEAYNANIDYTTISVNLRKKNILNNQVMTYTMNTKDFPGLGYV